jgi:hypothetical protein
VALLHLASTQVAVLQPALELGVEVCEAGEVLAVEGRAGELLKGGALEALADRVVVGRAWRDAVMAHAADVEVLGEGLADELWTVVAEGPPPAPSAVGPCCR